MIRRLRPMALAAVWLATLGGPLPAYATGLLPPLNSDVRELVWKEEDGSEGSLASLHGKPVVLHFWAAWCTACVGELPAMVEWKERQRDVAVVFVSLDQKIAQARYFIDKHHLPMEARLASMSDLGRFGLRGLPATVLLDAEGREIGRIVGAGDWSDTAFTGSVYEALDGRGN